jgi:cell division protein FtsB
VTRGAGPTGRKPAARKPATRKPAAAKPAARKPAAAKPAARKPATRKAGRTGRLRRVAAGDRPYVVALLGLVAVLVMMAIGPLQSFTVAAERVDDLSRSRDQLREEVDRLEDRRTLLLDHEELELLAREQMQLVRPGEIPFVVVTPGGGDAFEPEVPAEAPAPEDEHAPAWWQRLWQAFGGLFSDADAD